MPRTFDVSIIPARNKEATHARTVRAAYAYLKDRQDDRFEIVIVPNRAQGDQIDRTEVAAQLLEKELPGVYVYSLPSRPGQGKGAATKHGVKHSRGKYIFLTHADLA